jgi:hypothetical protein
LDYFENNLEPYLKSELETFLKNNPDIKNTLNDFEIIQCVPEIVNYPHKEKLLKSEASETIGISYLDYLCIADLENDISVEEKKDLNNLLKRNPEYLETYRSYKKTKLSPNELILFPLKRQLQKNSFPIIFNIVGNVAAAIIVLYMGVSQSGFFKDTNSIKGSQPNPFTYFDQTKPGYDILKNTNHSFTKQDPGNTHNQTDKQIHNTDLAFNDIEPLDEEIKYKESVLTIPDLKSKALIFDNPQPEIPLIQHTYAFNEHNDHKNILWKSAELGLNLWKIITSDDDLEMNNRYYKDGSIEKLAISNDYMKFSRTFNKTNSQFIINQ